MKNDGMIKPDHNFRQLMIWQKSITYVTKIYAITSVFPKKEIFGLTDQIRRASTSISLNIAEGAGSGSNPEFIRFLHIAKRSAFEVISGLEIAHELKYISIKSKEELVLSAEELCSMIIGLIKKLSH